MKTELQTIPGVGPAMEQDLVRLGYTTLASLAGADPQDMYDRLCALEGCTLDRCVLYVFRCAVYYAETSHPDPQKCKWWNWKD